MSGLTGGETKYISSHTIAEHEAAIGNAKTKASMLLALGLTQDELDALTGAAYASGTNVLVTTDDIAGYASPDDLTAINAKLPTTDQKAALSGTSGTPSASNQFVTDADTRNSNARTPTAHATTHASGGSDPVTPTSIGAATSAQGAKADSAVQPTRTVNGHPLSADVTVTKSDVGLGDCDNTADIDKPLSTAATTALAAKAALAGSSSQAFATSTAASGSNTTLAASTAFVQAAIPVVPWYFALSATGTGSGVATLQLTCTAPTTLTITGGGSFYTDSGGTIGATTSWSLVVGLNTIYIKVTSGASYCEVEQGAFVSKINSWTASTNAPSIKFRLSSLPSGVTYVSIAGSNTISGSLADLPSGVTIVSIIGSNTVSGSLADLPSGVTYVNLLGSNTISGSLADLPSGVTYVSIAGSNTISGSIADLPSGVTYVAISGSNTVSGSLADLPSCVTYVSIAGSNTVSGSLADLPSGVTLVSIAGSNTISGSLADLPSGVTIVSIIGSNTVSGSLADLPSGVTYVKLQGSNTCTYNTASGSRTWASGMRAVYNRPATGVMTSAMIDALLIDLATQTTWATEKTININGTRTSASDAAVTTLTGYGVAVTVN